MAAGTAHREPLPVVFAANRRLLAQGACLAGAVSAASGLMQGCRGRSPRRNKLKISPFPPGRGSGGWGQETKLKAGQAGGKEGKPPLRTPQRQGQPAIKQASTPCGHHSGKVSRQPAGQAAQRAPTPQVQPVLPPAQARGCKGRSPLHKITLKLPLPAGKGGRGMGAKKQANGRAGRRQRRQAPRRGHGRQKL